jgi:hypothetical protein
MTQLTINFDSQDYRISILETLGQWERLPDDGVPVSWDVTLLTLD